MINSKNYIFQIILLLGLINYGCNDSKFELESGDLLFQVNEGSDFCEAIDESTGFGEDISFSHVGIIAIDNDNVYVIEAVPEHGVQKISLESFLASAAHNSKGEPMLVVYRLKSFNNFDQVLLRANSFIGSRYDSVFLPDNSAFYCSELVYESFVGKSGQHIFTQSPMSFSDSTGRILEFWLDYFSDFNISVPEGVLGTNPNDMSKDSILSEVYRYF